MPYMKRPSPLRLSLLGEHEETIGDRIAFVLVRDGISRKDLARAIGLDESLPYFMQDRTPIQILYQVADFLGVCAEWLAIGQGSSERKSTGFSTGAPSAESVVMESAIVAGNRARTIHVHNYAPREGAGR